MKLKLLTVLILVATLNQGAMSARAQDESELIGILQSNAGVVEKCQACQQLRVVGTSKSVASLAPLLKDERVSQAARYALEGQNTPEAGAALREAFATTSGKIKAGLADSLGWRKDQQAIPQLVVLLSDNDPILGIAAAAALGRIGGRPAVAALMAAQTAGSPPLQAAARESLLRCGEDYLAAGDAAAALGVYNGLLAQQLPDEARVAAWLGLAKADPPGNPERFSTALQGGDPVLMLAALKSIRQLNDAPTWEACAKQ